MLGDDGRAVKAIWEDPEHVEAGDRAILAYVDKLTRTPGEMTRADVERLRDAGFSDREILDIALVASLFNFFDRMADGLGVELEEQREAFGAFLLGAKAEKAG